MKINGNTVRGTFDYLPLEKNIREYAKNIIVDTYSKNGFLQIETPVLENMEVLLKDDGENTKLMYKILKRGEKLDLTNIQNENELVDCGLRYDLTVPLVRMYCGNSEKLPNPFKSIQIADVFRAERPQKGRKRQFIQCDVDILGDGENKADIEVLYTGYKALKNLGFKSFNFGINDRRILNYIIESSGYPKEKTLDVCITLDKLDKVGEDGVRAELVEKGYDEKCGENLIKKLNSIMKGGIEELNKIGVNPEYVDNLQFIINTLNSLFTEQVRINYLPTLVRGQGYYTSTVFEVYIDGYSGACGGGGRYDNMLENFSGKRTPAVGFSIGFERICLFLENMNIPKKLLAILYTEQSIKNILQMSDDLQEKGFCVTTLKKSKNISAQLERLKQNGYKYFINLEKGIEIKEI